MGDSFGLIEGEKYLKVVKGLKNAIGILDNKVITNERLRVDMIFDVSRKSRGHILHNKVEISELY
jgi:hypothetical protein